MHSASAKEWPPAFHTLVMRWWTINMSFFVTTKVALHSGNCSVFCPTVTFYFFRRTLWTESSESIWRRGMISVIWPVARTVRIVPWPIKSVAGTLSGSVFVLMHVGSSVVVVYGTNLLSRQYFMVYSKLMKSWGNEAYVNHILQWACNTPHVTLTSCPSVIGLTILEGKTL